LEGQTTMRAVTRTLSLIVFNLKRLSRPNDEAPLPHAADPSQESKGRINSTTYPPDH